MLRYIDMLTKNLPVSSKFTKRFHPWEWQPTYTFINYQEKKVVEIELKDQQNQQTQAKQLEPGNSFEICT